VRPYWQETIVVAPRGFTVPLRVAEKLAMNVAGLVVATGGPVTLSVVIAAEPGAGTVGRHNSEMINGVCTQPADVSNDVPIGVSGLSLHGGCGSISGRGSILERDGRGRSMRIE